MANVHVLGIGNRLRSFGKEILDLQLDTVKKVLICPTTYSFGRSRDGSQKAESWQTANEIQDFRKKDLKEHRAWDKLRNSRGVTSEESAHQITRRQW